MDRSPAADNVAATVVVIAWNGAGFICDCLDSLAAQEIAGGFTTWVIDNASTDQTAEVVARHPSSVRLIRCERNVGFAGAAALAVQEARTPYVVLVNQDAVAEPGWLAALLEPLSSADVAAVTSKVLLAADGRINNTGVLVAPDGYGRDRGFGEPDDGRYGVPEDVFAFSGTAAAIRVAAARSVGSFDASFFLYYEDTDLSWRLQLAGWRMRYAPSAVVRHLHAASSDVRSAAFAFYNERNRLLMLVKCAPISLVVKEIFRFAAITVLLPVRRMFGVQVPAAQQFRTAVRLRVLASLVGRLPSGLVGRRAVARTAHKSRREVVRDLAG
ncbi:MAG: glycosyltransferase family 2 protein, partial [Acidothermaceae bacterium]